MKCELCQKFFKEYPLTKEGVHILHETDGVADVTQDMTLCAFRDGHFTDNNFCCQSLLEIREEMHELWGMDEYVGTYYSQELDLFVIMTWYKHRGRISNVLTYHPRHNTFGTLTRKDANTIAKKLSEDYDDSV